jgi:hypothetical protein
MILAIEGDRGQASSVSATTAAGERIHLDPGMAPRFADARPEVLSDDGKHRRVQFTSEKSSRDYIDAVKRKNPGREITIENATVGKVFPGHVELQLVLGGREAHRSAIKSALVLVAHRSMPEVGLERAWRYVGNDDSQEEVAVNFTSAPSPWLPNSDLGPVPHLIAVASDRASQTIKMHVRYFGDIAIAATLARDEDVRDWRIAYAMDPLSGNEEQTDAFGGAIGEPAKRIEELEGPMANAHRRILKAGEERGLNLLIQRVAHEITERHLGKLREGDPITEEMLAAIEADIKHEADRYLGRIDSHEADPDLLERMRRHAEKPR